MLKEEDMNTVYFHAVANQRRRKKAINSLEGPDGLVENTPSILKLAVDYYSKLFGAEPNLVLFLTPERYLLLEGGEDAYCEQSPEPNLVLS